MKAIFMFCFSMISSLSFAQLEQVDFPDFTHTDIEGNSHHLYDYLDDGKIVLIDIFATWCPNCVASIPGVQEIWEAYGPNGDNTVVILGFERDPGTSNEVSFVAIHGIEHPVIAEAHQTVLSWGITYQPNYFVICPDRTYDIKVGAIGANPTPILNLVDQCSTETTLAETEFQEEILISIRQAQLTIENAGLIEYPWFICDISGKRILGNTAIAGSNVTSLATLQSGVYVLVINGKSHKFAL